MSAQRNSGFSLVELMIALAISALLLAFAVPAYQDFMAQHRADSYAAELSSALATARNVALSNRRTSVWSPQPSPTAATSWSVNRDTATGASLQQRTIDAPVTINFNAGSTTAQNVTQIQFLPAGQVQVTISGVTNTLSGTWSARVCDSGSRKEIGSVVSLRPSGLITVTRDPGVSACNP